MAKKEAGKSFLLRLDVATMEKIEAWAAQEFRSVNGQIQWIIADALRRHGRSRGNSAADTETAGEQLPSDSSVD